MEGTMKIKTEIRAGQSYPMDSSQDAGSDSSNIGRHYMTKWRAGYHCHGKKDQYGNVSNATCRYIWPLHAQPPV